MSHYPDKVLGFNREVLFEGPIEETKEWLRKNCFNKNVYYLYIGNRQIDIPVGTKAFYDYLCVSPQVFYGLYPEPDRKENTPPNETPSEKETP